MKIPFYILGLLLRYGPQHGYSLKQIVEEQIAAFNKIKLPTLYYHLEKLHSGGYISVSQERDGNRPEKSIYTITKEGEAHFERLLRKQLTAPYETEFYIDGALYFSDHLDKDELTNEITKRIAPLVAHIQKLSSHCEQFIASIPGHSQLSAKSIFNHHLAHLRAELEWLEQLKIEFDKSK